MPRRERPLTAGEGQDGLLREFAEDLRRLRQKAGSPPYRELAERAHYAISTLSSAASGQRLPTLAVTLAYVRACDGDVEEWNRRWREVAQQLGEEPFFPGATPESKAPAPYTGLRPFGEQDAKWFFGRERLVEELAGRLERQRFVVVIGASGSGKSSLLRAGLVPRLRDTATVVVLTPGARPLEECAIRLGALAGLAPGALYQELMQDPRNLGRLVRQITAGSDLDADDVVLVVDQFEELFTLCQDSGERDRFIEALMITASDEEAKCRVTVGLRADFYAHCTRNPLLVEAMRDAQVPVGPMGLEELRRAIVQPARCAGLTVESALLSTLTTRAHGQPGVLPLLSHALLQTWRRRRGNALTLEAFEAVGGLDGALARSAEDFYLQLDPRQQLLARRVFLRLTALGDGTEDTRRPVRMTELIGLAEDGAEDDIVAVLDRAAAARLLTLDSERVELAHEALIQRWRRLHGWLTEDREALRVHRDLTEAAHTWEALGRDSGALYRGTRLELATGLDRASLSARERKFLDASLAVRTAEREATRRRVQLRRTVVGLLSALLVLATTTAIYAVRAQRTADRQRDIASSQRVAEKAAALRAVNPSLAAQLGLAAYRLSATPQARGAVLSTFAAPYATELTGRTGIITTVATSTGGLLLTVGGANGTVNLWRAADPHKPRRLSVLPRPASPVRTAAISPDGRLLATGGADGTVTVWDAGDARRPRPLAHLPAGAGPVVALGFGPGGRTLVTTARNDIRLWHMSEPRMPRRLAARHVGAAVTAMAFHRDGRMLATGHSDHTVRLWEVTEAGEGLRQSSTAAGHDGDVNAVAFAANGRTLATGSEDFTVRLWDVTGPREVHSREVLVQHTDAVNAVAFGPDGSTLATASVDATVRRWEVPRSGPARALPVLTGHTDSVETLAFSSDGHTLVTGGEDQTVRLWDQPGPALAGHASSVYSVAYSPDARLLATGSYDRTVVLWSIAATHRPRKLARLTGHTGPVNSVVFLKAGRTLASGSADGTLRLWSIGTADRPRLLRTVDCGIGNVNSLAYSPDSRILATGGEHGTVRLWDTADARRPRPLTLLETGGAVQSVAFTPDGRTLAVGSRNHRAVLWDVTERRRPLRLAVLAGHTDAVKTVAFSPDGRTLATGSEDRTVGLWDLADPHRPIMEDRLGGYVDGVMSVAFAPDGRTLAAGSSDRTVRLYSTNGRKGAQELALLAGHAKAVDTLAFGPDGRTLATGGEDWTARLWDPSVQRVASRICHTVFPPISRAEWREHLPRYAYRPPCAEH